MSQRDFFAQVDRALATGETDSDRLLELLDEEQTRIQLPPEVYAELQRRVHQALAFRQSGGEETRVQTNPANRMAPRFTAPGTSSGVPHPTTPGTYPPGFLYGDQNADDGRIKGVGDTLNGRFVLEECIGFGGMGTVYKALDLRKLEASDRKPYIAIKVLNVQFRGHPKSLITLQREAKKAQTLAHPNIVTVYDFDRDGSMVYLTMEYLSGKPLSQTLRAPGFGGMPYAEAMHIVEGVGKALAYAHERGFVHCDLKPANVFVTDSGDVKVIDFGIARVFQKPKEDVEATVFDPGSLGGLTPAYASPEMLEHREPDPRDDIYALGCITYELLTGRHPFGRVAATQARNAGMRPQRPRNLGGKQWRGLKCALCFEREGRTASVARFLQDMSASRRTGLYAAALGSGVAAVLGIAIAYQYWLPAEAPTEQAVAPQVTPAPVAQAPAPPTSATIDPVLAGVPCAALVSSIDGRSVQVRGYLPESFGADRLKERLSKVPGVNTVALDVQQVNDDKCEVIKLFAPYWSANLNASPAAALRTKKAGNTFTEGDPLVLDISTPAFDSFVYIDYYVLDGSVYHLVPSPRARAHQAPPNYSATIGSLGNWVVSKPFGTELVVLLVTPEPLFQGLRPENESVPDYLRAVEQQLEKMVGKYGRERIAVDFLRITTQARKS